MLVVAALGGNALMRRGQPLTPDVQRQNARKAAEALALIVRAGHQLVVTHGNGPQVGLLALQSAAYDHASGAMSAAPLDVLGAETEGMIGYLLEQEIENALHHRIPVATLLTQVEVDPDDPAFADPTKFVGPIYTQAEARIRAESEGWQIAPDGPHWRRVVASPAPKDIPDLSVIRLLVDAGVICICTGGGGIPIIRAPDGTVSGIEAVIDKDHASALLARLIQADALLFLTDVEAVQHQFGTPQARAIRNLDPETAQNLDLPAGSMRPKVRAALAFAQSGGYAAIGRLEDAVGVLAGGTGTRVLGCGT
jgi:carbamate kinase